MSNEFKVGDKVRVIKRGSIEWESEGWTMTRGLRGDEIYTIYSVGKRCVTIEEDKLRFSMHPDHFEFFDFLMGHIEKTILFR